MSSGTSFKGQYKHFEISLELNTANVLRLQATDLQTKQRYSFSIDKTYLFQHNQFWNLIQEPAQILSFFQSKFQSVVFNEGLLTLTFAKGKNINILLHKEPPLNDISSISIQIDAKNQKIKEEITKEFNAKLQIRDKEINAQINNLTNLYSNLKKEVDQLRSQTINYVKILEQKDAEIIKLIQSSCQQQNKPKPKPQQKDQDQEQD